MSGVVQVQRQEPSPDEMLSGGPISSGRQWYPAAFGSNWLAGQSAVLVPNVVIDKSVVAGSTGVLHFRALTRAIAIERVWMLRLRTATTATATIKAPASTGASLVVGVSPGRMALPIVYREILASQASALTDLTIEVAAATGDIEIDSLCCFELARIELDVLGVDPQTERPRQSIYEGTGVESATGVIASLFTADPRRVGMFHWAVPVITPVTRNGAYTNLLTLAQPMLARKLSDGANSGVLNWSAYAKVNAGTGEVRVSTSNSGVSDPVTVSVTSFAWTTAREIEIDCEDMSKNDGLPGGLWDDLQIQIRGNGADTLSIAALSVWDAEAT